MAKISGMKPRIANQMKVGSKTDIKGALWGQRRLLEARKMESKKTAK